MDDATPLFNALLAYASASPISLLLDATSGPVDATFFLYHRLRAALRAEPPATDADGYNPRAPARTPRWSKSA